MSGAVGLIERRPGGDREPDIAGDPAAAIYTDWETVYQDNVVGIYQLAFRSVGNAADADDVAEDVMIRTLKTLRAAIPARIQRARGCQGDGCDVVQRAGVAVPRPSEVCRARTGGAGM